MMQAIIWLGRAFGGNSDKWAKRIGITVSVLLVLFALYAAVRVYNGVIISNYSARQDAATARADSAANEKAAEQRRDDDARISNEAAELDGSVAHAQTENDRRIARMRCISLQQAARAAGSKPPACN